MPSILTAPDVKKVDQDYYSEAERLHLERNPGTCVFLVTLVDKILKGEILIRIFTNGEGFAAVRNAVNPVRREMKLDSAWEIFESIQIENPF